ncbi:MAG: Na/Pi symporter [candidate division WOR-3 bacterium]
MKYFLTCISFLVSLNLLNGQPTIQLTRAFDINQNDISGDNQIGEVGRKLPKPIIVSVTDAQGKPLAGVLIQFSVLTEPRANRFAKRRLTITKPAVLTNESGYAKTEVYLGENPGEYQILAQAGDKQLIFSFIGLAKRWYLFLIFGLVGGLSFFLFGLYYGTKGLKRLAGNRLRDVLFNLTKNRFLGVLVGIAVTAILQSSTATTILLVVFAASGILGLGQSLGVILGADIGTTLTAQLLSLQIYDYAILVVIIGFALMHTLAKLKDIGQAIFGFGIVFFSIKLVLDAAQPLKYFPEIEKFLITFGNMPWLGIIVAMTFTFLVRSSAATIGIVIGLAFAGLMNLTSAVPLILGANLGTSFSTLLAGYRANNVEAKRVAAAHTIFKLIIVVILYPFLSPLTQLIGQTAGSLPRQIANGHTMINLFACILFLPILKPYEQFLNKLIPKTAELKGRPKYLSPALLETPAVAVAQATREVLRMGDMVLTMFQKALIAFLHNNKDLRKEIMNSDDMVDALEESITTYLTQIGQGEISPELSRKCTALLYIVDDLEHIGDIVSKSLTSYIKKKIDFNLAFSEEGLKEISQFHTEVSDVLTMALAALAGWDMKLAEKVNNQREIGNERLKELHNRHLERLAKGLKESIDTSTIHLDFINDLERCNYHASKIGLAILESA